MKPLVIEDIDKPFKIPMNARIEYGDWSLIMFTKCCGIQISRDGISRYFCPYCGGYNLQSAVPVDKLAHRSFKVYIPTNKMFWEFWN